MRQFQKLFRPPQVFVFASFLCGLLNIIDTSYGLLFGYEASLFNSLGISLKPIFFIGQALCLGAFLVQSRSLKEGATSTDVGQLLSLHWIVLVLTLLLFLFYTLVEPGSYEILLYADSLWLICYVISLVGTCFWFVWRLRLEIRFRQFSLAFLLIGGAFLAKFLNEIYLWPQTLLDWTLPSSIELVTMLSPAVLMSIAIVYTWFRLSIRPKGFTRASIAKVLLVGSVFLLPSIWDPYKNGLINLIIRSIVYWGFDYSGYGWFHAGVYLASLVTYLLLVRFLSKHFDSTIASSLILLGVISFPWNGITVFTRSYSSIPGNILSLDALIVGFYLRVRDSKKSIPD